MEELDSAKKRLTINIDKNKPLTSVSYLTLQRPFNELSASICIV